MSEPKATQFKVCLKDSRLDVKVGNNVCVSADTNVITGLVSAIGAATTTLGMQSCLALGGAAAGLFVVAKAIAKHWPFVKTSDVKEGNVIQVSVPPEKEKMFENVLKKGKLQKVLQEEFEDIDENLEGILGEEAYKDHGRQVLDLIRNLRVDSVDLKGTVGGIPEDLTAMRVVKGQCNLESRDQHNLVAVDGSTKGVAVMEYIGEGGEMTAKFTGGSNTVIAGDNDAIKRALAAQEKMNESKIVVTVNFPDDLSAQFQQKFQPTDKIINVRSALKEEKEKLYFLVREGKPGEILPNSLRVVDIKDDLYGFESEERALKQ